jgi:SAM-dependent methyltransferase
MPDLWNVARNSLLRIGRGFDLAARVCASLAAATLQTRDIRSDTEHSWGRFHALDADIDRGLFAWEEPLVRRFVNSRDRVLVVGCGTGRDVIALSARGHVVTGVDAAPAAVALAREACARREVAAKIVHGYFEDVALSERFDAIILSYLCYGYIPESSRRIAVLRKARTLLAPGGRVLISYVGNRERRRSKLFALVQRGARFRGSDWHPEEGDLVHPMLSGRPRFHYEHIFVPGELQTEAAAADLRVIFHDDASFDYWIAVLAA